MYSHRRTFFFKLTLKAHANVKLGRDEYVTEALLTFQKVKCQLW